MRRARTGEIDDPVLGLVAERAWAGSRPGERSDGFRLALSIEGGGMAGAVSAGMCTALERLGLTQAFDVIYGSSAGAINASYTASGQAHEHSGVYVLAAQRRVIDMRRAALLRPPFRLAEIGTHVLEAHLHDPAVLSSAPSLRVTGARVGDKTLATLSDFASLRDLRKAVLASCANPILADGIVEFRGERFVDGGLIESIPFPVALREGATHVLVLRSRHRSYRAPEFRGVRRRALLHVLRRAPDTVTEMVFEWPARYDADARHLEERNGSGAPGHVTQITPPPVRHATSSYERRPGRLRERIVLGATAAYSAFAPIGRLRHGVDPGRALDPRLSRASAPRASPSSPSP